MKQLKLIIQAKENKIYIDGTIENITPVELVGLYELLKSESQNKTAESILLQIIFYNNGIAKKQVIKKGVIPLSTIYEALKNDAIKKIKKQMEINYGKSDY